MMTQIQRFLTLALTFGLLLSSHAFASKVYKWTDEAGNTHFSQFPPEQQKKAEQVNVKTTQGDTKAGKARLEKLRKQLAEDIDARNQRKVDAEEQKKKDEQMAQACSAIKSELALLKKGGRLYTMKEDGERDWYDEERRQQAIKKAEAQKKRFCK